MDRGKQSLRTEQQLAGSAGILVAWHRHLITRNLLQGRTESHAACWPSTTVIVDVGEWGNAANLSRLLVNDF